MHRGGLWILSKENHICSKHFVDGEPTPANPNPTLSIGYDTIARALLCSPPTGRESTEEEEWSNIIRKKTSKLDKKLNKEPKPDDKLNNFEIYDVQLEIDETVYFDLCDLKKNLEEGIINNNYGENDNMPVLEIQSLPLTYNLLFVILFPFLLLIIKILH